MTNLDSLKNNDDNKIDDKDHDDFSIKEIAPDIVLCQERHYTIYNVANLYLVRGTQMDLIVDTGVGLWDFAAFLRAKGLIRASKPHLAVAAHVHFDHAGGLYQFDQGVMHHLEVVALKQGDSYEACCFMSDSECTKPPSSSWRTRDYSLVAVSLTRILTDGDALELSSASSRSFQ